MTISIPAKYSYIYPSLLWPDEYTAHWITCPYPLAYLDKYGVPKTVSVVPTPCSPPIFHLSVNYKSRKSPREGIALCLPAMYKTTDWIGVAEWIIIHKFLGYRTVIAYTDSTSGPTSKVLSLFASGYDPSITVVTIPWNIPHVKKFYFGQHASINDCLYRAGLSHQYATIADKDEIVMPLAATNLPGFLSQLEQVDTGAYMVQHVLFDIEKVDLIDNNTLIDLNLLGFSYNQLQLTSLKHRWHMLIPYPGDKVRSKTIYNIDRTISADVHFPYQLVPGYREVMVAPSSAVVYHYKTQPPNKWLNGVPYTHESRMDLFKNQLLTEVAKVMKIIKVS